MSTCAGAKCMSSWTIRSAANGTTSACRSSFPLRPRRSSGRPLLGEHTEEILKEVLGWSDAEIAAKKEAGAFSRRRSGQEMKIAIIGQQDFGKAVLEAFLARGDEAAAVFCAPEKEGAGRMRCGGRAGEGSEGSSVQVAPRSGGLAGHGGRWRRHRHHGFRVAVRATGICDHTEAWHDPVSSVAAAEVSRPEFHQLADNQGRDGDRADHFPPIRRARRRRCILQKRTAIGPDDTLGTVYFDRLFPMGVQAMLEAADLVLAGKYKETEQDESQASYEGWCRSAEAKIDWAKPIDHVYNLIRGCNPAPGAWTTFNGKKLRSSMPARSFSGALRTCPGRSARSRT